MLLPLSVEFELEQLRKDEGFSPTPYRDSEGKLTIGYGTLIESGISKDEANLLLRYRLHTVWQEFLRIHPWALSQIPEVQQILANMAYNLGVRGLCGFKRMLSAIKEGDFNLAATEALDSKWASQVGPRATRLADRLQQCSAP